ncbi:VOC family protein [Streptomyces thermocarboxydovorans]|uniref:VOC family protein n=1 Tax=Streptomyces thermocarboxydovorans TaxID=59298 RepID=A0ABN1HNF2_9ACTN
MASRLNPYLSFDGGARQAMEFYKDVFGGELHLNTYGDIGQSGPEYADKIMHGMLETPSGFTLMGADHPPGMEYKPGNTYSVSLSGDDESELRGYWEKLSSGNQVSVPLERQMWGDVFGMCTDQFGVTWMVNISTSQG